MTKEETNEEYFLNKEWNDYIKDRHEMQLEQIKKAISSQELALNELKIDNIDLYNMAIQVNYISTIFQHTMIKYHLLKHKFEG